MVQYFVISQKKKKTFAKKHMKRYSTSLVNIEIQINNVMRYHFTPTRWANMKKSDLSGVSMHLAQSEDYHLKGGA